MKAFVIYIDGHAESETYALAAVESMARHKGWEPHLFKGLVPDTARLYGENLGIRMKRPSRAADFLEREPETFRIKRACSFNHHRLFRMCVNIDEPIAVIEHDARCVADWRKGIRFKHVLTMNLRPAIAQFRQWKRATRGLEEPEPGVTELGSHSVPYRHDPSMPGRLMPGTGAYAVTPEGARLMLESYAAHGWEQSDLIINTHTVTIEKIIPELFEMAPNLRMSHHDARSQHFADLGLDSARLRRGRDRRLER